MQFFFGPFGLADSAAIFPLHSILQPLAPSVNEILQEKGRSSKLVVLSHYSGSRLAARRLPQLALAAWPGLKSCVHRAGGPAGGRTGRERALRLGVVLVHSPPRPRARARGPTAGPTGRTRVLGWLA